MRRYPGAKWDKSPLNMRVYEAEFGTLGGKPFGALIGDYYFDHGTADVALLRDISKVAAAAACAVPVGGGAGAVGHGQLDQLATPPDLSEIFDTPDYAAWNGCAVRELALCGAGGAARAGARTLWPEFQFGRRGIQLGKRPTGTRAGNTPG